MTLLHVLSVTSTYQFRRCKRMLHMTHRPILAHIYMTLYMFLSIAGTYQFSHCARVLHMTHTYINIHDVAHASKRRQHVSI